MSDNKRVESTAQRWKRVSLQVLLFSLAPFFVYPWKPLVNAVAGESYDVALRHFKAGHRGAVNLAGHVVGLVFCVFGNFALLDSLDRRVARWLGDDDDVADATTNPFVLSTISAAVWIAVLVAPATAPPIVRASSVVLITSAYRLAPSIPQASFERTAVAALVLSVVATNLLTPNKSDRIRAPLRRWVPYLLLAPGLSLAFRVLASNTACAGALSHRADVVAAATLGLLALIAATPNPIVRIIFAGVISCRVAHVLTGVDELFYLGCGFASSLFQFACHMITEEKATLIAHGEKGASDEIALEYAHVVYFPNIALETVYQKLTTTTTTTKRE